jgi:hypothetical protein
MANTYMIINGAQGTNAPTAAPVKQPTGTAIRTMLQIAPATGWRMRVLEWGCSFDASAAATPGQIELVDTLTVFGTLTTALALGDIMPFDSDSPANTSGSSGLPCNLSTSTTAFASASGTEGSVAASCRYGDLQMVAPTNQYLKQFPLGREFMVPGGHALRIRATFGTTVNMYCYVIVEF